MWGWRVDLCSFFFFPPSFQFAYHLLHLPLLTPEGPKGDFDLNRKSGVVCLKISSSLHSAGRTLELRLDSETRFTWGSGSQGYWFDLKWPQSVHQIPPLSTVRVRLRLRLSGLTHHPADTEITCHYPPFCQRLKTSLQMPQTKTWWQTSKILRMARGWLAAWFQPCQFPTVSFWIVVFCGNLTKLMSPDVWLQQNTF